MRRTFFVTLLLFSIAAPAFAQDPPTIAASTDPVELGRSDFAGKWYGSVDFGVRAVNVDGDEARYQRFRDLRSGVYATNMLAGRRTQDWTFELQGWNVGYRDQRYTADIQAVGKLKAAFMWDQIPMFISRDTSTLYTEVSTGVFRIEDTIQQQIQAGTKTLRNFEDQAVRFDMRTQRNIASGDIVFSANRSTDLYVSIRSTDRSGSIPFGGTFGFNNAVELPVPVETRTTDVRTALEWGNQRGMLSVGWDGSAFNNDVASVIWDNPIFFGPDTTAAPSQGRMSLWPDNTLTYLHGTGAVNFAGHSRLTGYVAVGEGRSNADLLPYTINTAINQPQLSRSTAEGQSDMTIAQATFASRPAPRLSVNARYRHAESDIKTPIFDRTTGSVQYDTSLSATATPSEYHSVTRNTFDADAAFEVAPFTSLKVGYSNLGTDYENRIWESTKEDVFRVSLDTTGNQYFSVRGLYENRSRTGENFEDESLKDAGELADMRHYDVADRNRDRFTFIATATPGNIISFNASAGVGRDEYPNSGHGLQNYDSNQYSVGFDLAPDNRYNLTANYGWERYSSLQRSRTANDATQQADPTRDWTTDYDGKVNYFQGDLTIDGAITRTIIRISGDWNRSNDTYLYGLVTGSPLAVPEQLPPVRNELTRAAVDVTYEINRNLHFGAAYWFDDYNVEDFALGETTLTGLALPPVQPGIPPAATNALLLGYLYRPYTAHAGFVRLTYGF